MKQVIILEKDTTTTQTRFRYALWAVVPIARRATYANPSKTSAFSGVSAQELSDIQAGMVVERVDAISIAAGTTLPAVQAELQTTWAAFQAEINNTNPWTRYGTFWDGSTWTGGGLS